MCYPHARLGTKPKFNAAININNYTFSVVYGGGSYGDGTNTYELAIINRETDDFIDIGDGDVTGWLSQEDINMLMNQATHGEDLNLLQESSCALSG